MNIILFLIVLAVLVLVHEFGHFIVAKKSGIRVDEFGLGFPPKIWSTKKGETTYSLNTIPFGGFVKIFGENPNQESLSGPDSARSFVRKPRHIQAAVLIAGIVFNLLFAWLLLSISFLFGVTASSTDYARYGERLQDQRIVVTMVQKGAPAGAAGLLPGDTILSVATSTKNVVAGNVTVEQVKKTISESKGNSITVSYSREGKTLSTEMVATSTLLVGKYAVGIAMDNVGTLQLPLHLAIWEGGRLTIHAIGAIAVGLFDFVVDAITGQADFSTVSGPVGIVGLVGDAARIGITHLLTFTAFISINLAIINLVPFPALDGGRLLFVAIEAIIRRPIKHSVANALNMLGFVLLMLLMLVVTYKDIAKLMVD
ncbi:RIP metalloprotease RseP [Patescibacteria group bacterium]|nr:MAG: RIP metalloprotease RseP [Patescibacteria group bacterium]